MVGFSTPSEWLTGGFESKGIEGGKAISGRISNPGLTQGDPGTAADYLGKSQQQPPVSCFACEFATASSARDR